MKWIAVRNLTTDKTSGSRKVEVSIGVPEKMKRHRWSCPVQVLIAGVGKVDDIPGGDGFGCLINSMLYIRRKLKELRCEFFWLTEDNEFRFGHGFPYFLLPALFGADFNKRVKQLVEKEMNKQIKKTIKMTKAERLARTKKIKKLFNIPRHKGV